MQRLEEKIAHLTHTIDELSEVIARQDTELSLLTHRVNALLKREAERETANPGHVALGDERPPHW